MGRLLRAPGDVLADGQGFARVGGDGRVLVTNAQDQCPECGCGGPDYVDPQAPCCPGSERLQVGGGEVVFSLPAPWPPVRGWCLGTGALVNNRTQWVRGFVESALVIGSTDRRNLGDGVGRETTYRITLSQHGGLEDIGRQVRSTATVRRSSLTLDGDIPGSFEAMVRDTDRADSGLIVRTGMYAGAAAGLSELAAEALSQTPRSHPTMIGGSALIGAQVGASGVLASGFPTAGSRYGVTAGNRLGTAEVGVPVLTVGGNATTEETILSRSWRTWLVSQTVMRFELSQVYRRRLINLLPGVTLRDDQDESISISGRIELVTPCPPVGGVSVGGEVENPTRWMGLEWEGEPMPLRVLSKLRGRPSSGCGCGCIRPLKRLWRRLLGAVPHPASA
jgi:hypothetical protein